MNREWIFWIALVAVIIVASLYLREFSNQELSLSVQINSSAMNSQIYPYQKLAVPITVQNTGGTPIKSVTLEVLINGSATTSYDVTIPPGKSTTISYNFTPASSGKYNVSVIADPGKLYDVSSRQNAQSAMLVRVLGAEPAASYSLLPEGNTTSYRDATLSASGLILSNFLSRNYVISDLSPVSQNDSVVYSLLNISEQYVKNMSASYAKYANGSSAYSVWIRGYLLPSIVGYAVEGRGYAAVNYTYGGKTVMFSNLGNHTTICSWYEGGWIKTVQYTSAGPNCRGIANGTVKTMGPLAAGVNSTIYNKTYVQNSTQIGSFNYFAGSRNSFAKMLLLNGSVSLIPIISQNTVASGCLGVVTSTQNNTFCTIYTPPAYGYELLKTTALIGGYNASVFSLVNDSPNNIGLAASEAVGLINGMGLRGPSFNFTSPNLVKCSFNDSFRCSNLTAKGNKIGFNLTNDLGVPVRINAIACYLSIPFAIFRIDVQVPAGGSARLSTVCYQAGVPVNGLLLDPELNLYMNYTYGNSNRLIHGNATVNLLT
ncbi:MAG: hypothetical protein KGH61_00800 [Candidatus Micrarchaeota archaeon]|nr:hypothetical protein [Candidatus Micrarchaeota archaeon]MDE1847475.1 hypothetical protein [Candidatus Micrarchaeota archaeon]MDE1864030.1 hypothetical protein [Candidatus Micrarchaeota archaeon]